jgi:hypothetical protein
MAFLLTRAWIRAVGEEAPAIFKGGVAVSPADLAS